MKKFLSLMLAVSFVLSSVFSFGTAVLAQNEASPIEEGADIDLSLGAGEEKWFSFIPESDGAYAFYSEGAYDTVGAIYDSSLVLIEENDDWNEYNFRVECLMEAGREYFLFTKTYGEQYGVYNIRLEELPTATALSLSDSSFEGNVGDTCGFELEFSPAGAYVEDYEVFSSDESVAIAYNNGIVEMVGSGNAVVTVVTERGLRASFAVSVATPESIESGALITLSYDSDYANKTYSFTPSESGYYAFSLRSELDTEFGISLLSDGSDIGEIFALENGVRTQAYLEAGKTYYICSRMSSYEDSILCTAELVKCVAATGVYFTEESYSAPIGERVYPIVMFSPENAVYEGYSLYSESPSVVEANDFAFETVGMGNGTVKVRTESGLSASASFAGEDYPTILEGEEVNILTKGDKNQGFCFIPRESGIYQLSSEGGISCFANLYDENGALLKASSEKADNTNFILQYELSAGKLYRFITGSTYGSGGEYTVKAEKCVKAQSISIYEGNRVTSNANMYYTPGVVFHPSNAIIEDYSIKSSNPEAFTVVDDHSGYFGDKGSAVITVTTESSLTTVINAASGGEYYSITLGEPISFDSAQLYGMALMEFIAPYTGTYYFTSEGESNTYAVLYDFGFNELISAYNSTTTLNYSFTYELEKGNIYYLETGVYGSNLGYSISVENITPSKSIVLNEGKDIKLDPELFIGYHCYVPVEILPEGANDRVDRWTFSNGNVAEVAEVREKGIYLSIFAEGVVDFTVYTESGLSDTVRITVGEPQVVVGLGDLDGDGIVGAKDVNIIKRYVKGSLENIDIERADFTMDGTVDSKDANYLIRVASGAIIL